MPNKAKSLVIGISGGIDSSVSSTLSAMTGLKTIVLSMPIKQKSAQHDLSLAIRNVPLTDAIDQIGLNVYDVLKKDHILFTKEGLKELEDRLSK